MSKLLIPNTCQVPNVIFDEVMPVIGGAALKVLMVIIRATYGFNVTSWQVSIDGLCKLSRLSRQSVIAGIKELGNLLVVKRGPINSRVSNEYALNVDISTGELVQKLDQSKNWTSPKSTPRLVQKLDSLKPIRETHKSISAKAPVSLSDLEQQTKIGFDKQTLPPKKEKSIRRGGAKGIPAELQPVVSKIVGRINDLAGSQYRDDKPDALRNLIARLEGGQTEAECLAVVDGRHAFWAGNDKMLEYFRPSTLFAAAHFEDYLQAAQRQGHTNGTAKPKQVKDLGNGFVEVDGKPIERRIYERRFANAAS